MSKAHTITKALSAAAAAWALAVAGPAWGADLTPQRSQAPVNELPYSVPVYDWSGLYLGGHAGGGLFQGAANNLAGSGVMTSLSGGGWLGGVQLGYNYQLGRWVLGLEGDWSYTDLRGTRTTPGLEQTVRLDWLGTVTGRAGIAWNRSLFYVKGGLAFGDVRSEALVPGTSLSVANDQRTGWTVGAGVEWGWTPNWSVKAEYDYLDLGTRTVTLTPSGAGPFLAEDAKATAHMIKLGANYRFNWR